MNMASTKKSESPIRPWYVYNVKFLWGLQKTPFVEYCTKEISHNAVLARGIYYTEVNIFNYHDDTEARIYKYYVQLVKENEVIGFEPQQQKAMSLLKAPLVLKPNSATGDDSCGLGKILKVRNLFNVGFLKIISDIPLSVTAVYTISDSQDSPVSIAVEQIAENRLEYHEEVKHKERLTSKKAAL
jgi:hypothetical protein